MPVTGPLSLTALGGVPTTRTLTFTGTANQVSITGGTQDLSANRTWSFSLPQDIATTSTPTFVGVNYYTSGVGIQVTQSNFSGQNILGLVPNTSGNFPTFRMQPNGSPNIGGSFEFYNSNTTNWSRLLYVLDMGITGVNAHYFASDHNGSGVNLPIIFKVTDNWVNSDPKQLSIYSDRVEIGTGINFKVLGLTSGRVTYTGASGLTDSANLTFSGTNLTITGTASTGLTSLGYSQIGVINSQTTPATQGSGGLGVLWNYSGGSAETALFNLFSGSGFTGGFRFFMGTGTNSYNELAWLSWNGGNSGLKLSAGSAFLTLNDWTMTRDGAGSVDASGHFGVSSFDWTSLSSNQSGLSSGINFNPASASSGRVWGLFFGASGTGSVNLTDPLALNGLEGNAGYNGSATVGGMTGGLMYTYNSSSGTVGEGQGLKILANVNSGSGHITLNEGIQIHTYGPAFSANNQTRIGLQFPNAAQNPGGFTGCIAQQIWFSTDTTNPRDGIGWGVNDDTIIYRGAAGQVNITSSLLLSGMTSGSIVFSGASGLLSQNNSSFFWSNTNIMLGINTSATPSAHLHVVGVTPVPSLGAGTSASFGAKIIGGTGGSTTSKTNNGGNGGALLFQGGPGGANTNGSASGVGGNGADVSINAGVGGTSVGGNGAVGSIKLFKSDGTTLVQRINDTGVGFFAATPVAQQSGDIGAALVALGLMSSATSTSNVVASGRQTAQVAADANVFTFTLPAADHSYLITSNILVTASTLHSFTTTCSYTDESNTARVLTLNYSQLTGAFVTAITNGTGASAYEGVPVQIRCKASTNVVVATTGTFTSVTYNVEAALVQLT